MAPRRGSAKIRVGMMERLAILNRYSKGRPSTEDRTSSWRETQRIFCSWAHSRITSLADTMVGIVCSWRRRISAQGIRRAPSPRMSALNVMGWQWNRGLADGAAAMEAAKHQRARTVFLPSNAFGQVPGPTISYTMIGLAPLRRRAEGRHRAPGRDHCGIQVVAQVIAKTRSATPDVPEVADALVGRQGLEPWTR